jgi:acyl-CoA hydrolase
MVSLGDDEKPMPIPALVPVTDEERRRCDEANLRREIRLAQPDALQRIRE